MNSNLSFRFKFYLTFQQRLILTIFILFCISCNSAIANTAAANFANANANEAADSHENKQLSIYSVDLLKDGLMIGFPAAGSLWAYANSDQLIRPRCPCNPAEVNSIDRPVIGNSNDLLDHVSDFTVAASVVFPIALDWIDVGWSKQFAEDMTILAESLSLNGGIVTLSKYTVQRPLPRTYQGDPDLINNPRGYRSFYSGHTSVALSSMMTAIVTHRFRHPDSIWPTFAAAAIGTSVAYERVAAGRHFYSDVVIGALVGATIGVLVPILHHHDITGNQSMAVLPAEDGAILIWKIKI
jgi:hypothetical protein